MLKQARVDLEIRVDERTSELKAANKALQKEIRTRTSMEEQLIRTQRLRTVTELSAGVSHNLNSILTCVLGPAQLIRRMTDDPDIVREIDDIISSATRARDLVSRLNQAVRGGDDRTGPVAVPGVIADAVHAARPRWKDEPEAGDAPVELVTELEDVPPVAATETGLHNILLNLIFNAVDAMPEGGRVVLRARPVNDDVEITVSDTGIGMGDEAKNRVFEPFYTTKADVGSGLGLSAVHNTVVSWNGSIEVISAPGHGATFRILLPAWTGPEPQEEEALQTPDHVHRGRLLIVEDDLGVCRLLTRLLSADHEVASVPDGEEAMEGFAPDKYDAVMIDLGMPGMPGDRVARGMRQQDPILATVLITGWDVPEDDSRRSVFDFHLKKPFDDLDKVAYTVASAVELHDRREKGMSECQGPVTG